MPGLPLFLAVSALAVTTPSVSSGEKPWMIWGFYGQSWFIFGSEDFRHTTGLTVQWTRPEPRFTFRGNRADLVLEANYFRSTGGNKFEFDADRANSFGLLALARYEFRPQKGLASYIEGGWGLQWIDRITIDLPSRINSTPTLGAGLIFPFGRTEVYVGVRWKHISNAGTRGNNPGQNQIMLGVGVRF